MQTNLHKTTSPASLKRGRFGQLIVLYDTFTKWTLWKTVTLSRLNTFQHSIHCEMIVPLRCSAKMFSADVQQINWKTPSRKCNFRRVSMKNTSGEHFHEEVKFFICIKKLYAWEVFNQKAEIYFVLRYTGCHVLKAVP